MIDTNEITNLREHAEHLAAKNAALQDGGFRGSKAEAFLALEYDRIPTFMKGQRAVAWQRKIATAVMIVVPLILLTVAIVGGVYAYRDHQQRMESHAAMDRLVADFQSDPAFKPRK